MDFDSSVLRNFISLILTEDAYSRNMAGAKFNVRDQVTSMIDDSSPPKRYFTMTFIPKVGVNPRSKYNTPIGVYCYPATREYVNKLIADDLPFVSNAPYVTFFEATDIDHMMTVGSQTSPSKFSNEDVVNIVEKEIALSNSHRTADDVMDKMNKHAGQNNDAILFGALFNIARDPVKWSASLRRAGVTAVYDPGFGIIHPSEPTQAVFLSPKAYNILKSFATEDIRKKQKAPEEIEQLKNSMITLKNIMLGKKKIESPEERRTILKFMETASPELMMKFLFGPGAKLNPNLVTDSLLWKMDSEKLSAQVKKMSNSDFDNTCPEVMSELYRYLRFSKTHGPQLRGWLLTSNSDTAKFVIEHNMSSKLLVDIFRDYPDTQKMSDAVRKLAKLYMSFLANHDGGVKATLKRLGIQPDKTN